MRVLLLHPEDRPDDRAWAQENRDVVVDLGFAGAETYADWSRRLKSSFFSIYKFAEYPQGYRWVNQVLERGRGRLLDSKGLDWWEILALKSYHDLHALFLVRQFQKEIGSAVPELSATRPHSFTKIAEHAMDVPIRYFKTNATGPKQKIGRVLRSARMLQPKQIVDIAFDKWDSAYQLRRHLARHRRARVLDTCVLLPSAYSNVTRSVLAYAASLPEVQFLLVTTRNNALTGMYPRNVSVAPLAAYVEPSAALSKEITDLQRDWLKFSREMRLQDEQFRCMADTGVWDNFPSDLARGLQLRDAWSNVLESEHISGVLCGDDLNHDTRLPLILARKNGLNALYCSHGALDLGFLFKKPFADAYLVKGEMEKDYLESTGAVDKGRIFVAAPGSSGVGPRQSSIRDAIVFFSQPYEVTGGRVESIYSEVLPQVYAISREAGRKLVVKLHPFESVRARRALVNSILATLHDVEIVGGVPPDEVISRAWCGVTVDSSIAVECALREIPVFLCGWLDLTSAGYCRQFARFAVGHLLNKPDEIQQIPRIVAAFRPDHAVLKRLWYEAEPMQLREIISGARQVFWAS